MSLPTFPTLVVGDDGAPRMEAVPVHTGLEQLDRPTRQAAAWAIVRRRRDDLLSSSDWVVVRALEVGAPVPPAWAAYRQALRDLPQQADPLAVEWPAPPEP